MNCGNMMMEKIIVEDLDVMCVLKMKELTKKKGGNNDGLMLLCWENESMLIRLALLFY